MVLSGPMRAVELQPRFPAVSFGSYDAYRTYLERSRSVLEGRYSYERSVVLPQGAGHRVGTCAPCLRRARFEITIETVERPDDGTVLPKWADQLECDCEDHLTGHQRALLHFVQREYPLADWHRLLAFGPLTDSQRRVCHRLAETVFVPRLAAGPGGTLRVAAEDGGFQIAICLDYLQVVPALPTALAELRRVLSPGGVLIVTVPFRWDRPTTRSQSVTAKELGMVDAPPEFHEFGWDILDRLREAGYARSRIWSYWSAELGYLGPLNAIISAET